MIRHDMPDATGAVELASEVLGYIEGEYPDDLYALPVHEVRILASAVKRMTVFADLLDAEADRVGPRGGAFTARAFATEIRNILNGENP